jgi:hypothetical protein
LIILRKNCSFNTLIDLINFLITPSDEIILIVN